MIKHGFVTLQDSWAPFSSMFSAPDLHRIHVGLNKRLCIWSEFEYFPQTCVCFSGSSDCSRWTSCLSAASKPLPRQSFCIISSSPAGHHHLIALLLFIRHLNNITNIRNPVVMCCHMTWRLTTFVAFVKLQRDGGILLLHDQQQNFYSSAPNHRVGAARHFVHHVIHDTVQRFTRHLRYNSTAENMRQQFLLRL